MQPLALKLISKFARLVTPRVLIKEGQANISADGYYGVRAMPARGGNPNLTVAEFAAAVVYLANQAGAKWQDPDQAMLKTINERLAKKQAQAANKKS